MTKKAVVTLGDHNFTPMTEITFHFQRLFAQRHGADFIVMQDRKFNHVNICYEKFRIGDFLNNYDRVLYLDGDVLVHPSAPDIFALVPETHFAAMDEAAHIKFWNEGRIRQQFEPYGWVGPWNGIHFNAGVMLLGRSHRKLFHNIVITDVPYWDQPYFNVSVFREGIPYFGLDPEWNYMMYHSYKVKDDLRKRAWFRHFSGGTRFEVKVDDAKLVAATFR
jgi:lipopolysaccharide biosynthesis glycosyltransferase